MVNRISCSQFFDGDRMYGPRVITLDESGTIAGIESFDGVPEYFCLSPGLVDLQMNGFAAHDVASSGVEELRDLGRLLGSLGTTSWLGTIVTAPLPSMTSILTRLHEASQGNTVPGFIGVHVEGPFLGAVPGAHRVKDITSVDRRWLESLPPVVRLLTLAAEQKDAVNGIASLRAKGVLCSIGHSNPNEEEYESAISAGATMVTHVFNAMSGVHHRSDGLALRALTDDRVTVGLIADLVHVSPRAVALAFRAKSEDGICLVSDSVAWDSTVAQRVGLAVTDAVRTADGVLAGSSTALSRCVRNVVETCGVSLERALRAATSAPADFVRNSDIGRIRSGMVCDMVAFDRSLTVVNTWRRLPSVGA